MLGVREKSVVVLNPWNTGIHYVINVHVLGLSGKQSIPHSFSLHGSWLKQAQCLRLPAGCGSGSAASSGGWGEGRAWQFYLLFLLWEAPCVCPAGAPHSASWHGLHLLANPAGEAHCKPLITSCPLCHLPAPLSLGFLWDIFGSNVNILSDFYCLPGKSCLNFS